MITRVIHSQSIRLISSGISGKSNPKLPVIRLYELSTYLYYVILEWSVPDPLEQIGLRYRLLNPDGKTSGQYDHLLVLKELHAFLF